MPERPYGPQRSGTLALVANCGLAKGKLPTAQQFPAPRRKVVRRRPHRDLALLGDELHSRIRNPVVAMTNLGRGSISSAMATPRRARSSAAGNPNSRIAHTHSFGHARLPVSVWEGAVAEYGPSQKTALRRY